MKNVERFGIYAAHILARMYEDFPMARTIDAAGIVAAVGLERGNQSDETWENTFVVNTYRWLVDTNYLIERDGAPRNRYVLAPKAFEVLKSPLPIVEKEAKTEDAGKSVGDKLVEVTTDVGGEVVSEGKKQAIQQLVGWIIGLATTAATSL